MMAPHQQRVVAEKLDLDERLGKLTGFIASPIFAGVDPSEQERLHWQRLFMSGYSEILRERIAAFKEPAS